MGEGKGVLGCEPAMGGGAAGVEFEVVVMEDVIWRDTDGWVRWKQHGRGKISSIYFEVRI